MKPQKVILWSKSEKCAKKVPEMQKALKSLGCQKQNIFFFN